MPPMQDMEIDEDEAATSLRRLGALLRPHFGRLLGVLGSLFALAGLNMALPLFTKLLLDDVFPNRNWSLLWIILVAIVIVYLGRNLLYFVAKFTSVSVGENVSFLLRNRLFERMQQMNLRFYQQNKPGQISSRVMDDSFVIQSFIQDEVPKLLQSVFMFLVLVAVIYAVNWQLALASTIVLPAHLWAARWFKRPIKTSSREAQQQLGVVQGNLIEKFLGAEVVKGFTGEARESEAFQEAIDLSRKNQLRSKAYHVTQKIVADLLIGIGTIGLLGFGAYQVMKPQDAMLPGTFVAFYGYVLMLYPTVLNLMSGFAKLTKASASIDRVFEMLSSEHVEVTADKPVRSPIHGKVSYQHVWYEYHEDAPVLRDVSIEIPAGKMCAIIGPSGSGKSTMVNLVPRFLEPDRGHVLLDDVDVTDYDLQYLRESIGIAFQECFLFNSSVLENLRYARPDATMAEIVEVAERTGAHRFISNLREGYGTVIGESGVSLSRGEKQRITLTRAMLKNPRVLILDEATASIDTASEAQIIPAILEFMQGRTTLMITHNPQLLQHADMVVRLVEGQVTYQGPADGVSPELLGAGSPTRQSDPAPRGASRGAGGVFGALLLVSVLMFGGSAIAQDKVENQAANDTPAAEAQAETKTTPNADAAQAADPETSQASGKFIALSGFNALEAEELLEVIVTRAKARMGYAPATRAVAESLPPEPGGLRAQTALARSSDEGLRLLQVGFKTYRSQPPHIWLFGAILKPGGQTANDDVDELAKLLADGRKTLAQQYENLRPTDLASRRVALSYIEADRCLGVLKTMGYQCVEYKGGGQGPGGSEYIDPKGKIDPKQLPVVIALPGTDATQLVGGGGAHKGAFGLTMTPSVAVELPHATSSAPLMELLVMYNPAKPEQLSEVVDVVRRTVDVPARQILIEAMVLEISETSLTQLGIDWELTTPFSGSGVNRIDTLEIGRLPAITAGDETLNLEISDVFGHFRMRLRALIEEGKAEILSRPSVLTLNNRQASIRVGEDIPVAKSASGLRGGDRITFDFQYIPVGILLNVRPRVAADNSEVSLQIDGIVSAEVPNEDLIIFDQNGAEVARAPRISTRRVQTYSRIANNTPFIIGGLISRDDVVVNQKVPLLGDLPLIGGLFRTTDAQGLKREVIIVLTPYVLPDNKTVGRNMPKDEPAFDSFGHQLFRDAYRIRAEDVFDLSFLLENRQLLEMKRLADLAVRHDVRLADAYPFNRFAHGRVPGERILVYRQMYEVIKRLDLAERIDERKVIFFRPDKSSASGFDVTFLWKHLIKITGASGDPETMNKLFQGMNGKALALTYTLKQFDDDPGNILSQPVPLMTLHECPDRAAWEKLLWDLNQPDEQGRTRFTILLQNPRDITRLKRAMLLKHTVQLNANRQALTLNNFSVGRLLLMPTVKPEKVYLIDEETAQYFFYTELYYPAVQQELTRDMEMLRGALSMPGIRRHLDEPPPQPDPQTPIIHLHDIAE